MKKSILSIMVVCLLPQIFIAQTTTKNFIKKTIPIDPVSTEASLNALSSSYKIESINYIDGLGRSIQDVLVKGSPANYDIVQPVMYDQYGRQQKSYLPYVDPTNDASFKTNVITNQLSFYTNQTRVAKTTSPFSELVFDGSPINNVLEKSAPDTDWQLGNGHTTKVENSFNSTADGIIDWVLQTDGDYWFDDGLIYAANKLSVTKLTDANGNYSFVYTDNNGKTICTKQFLEMRGTPQVPYYLTTYMIYDTFGQLIIVVPPKALDAMAGASNYSVNYTENLIFRYKYDERHRLIEKKVPGTGWSYIVYNQLNQPVLFQDANLKLQGKWSFIKYDVLNRPIMSGLYTSALNRLDAQALFNGTINDIGESEVPLDGNNPYGYTNVTLPNTNLDILTVNYYDDYDFDNNGAADYTFNSTAIPCLLVPTGIKGIACQPYTNDAVTNRTRGYLTGSRVKVLDPGNSVQWEMTAVFYDENGQAIQSQSNDHLGGTDLINTVYDWTGNVIHTQQLHTLSGQSNVQVLNHMYYDKMGRLTQVEQKNNSDAAVILANYNYNELSQVIEKNIHRISTAEEAGFLQSMDYRYSIQGWLTSINNIDLSSDMGTNPLTGTNDDATDLWGMQLNYNTNTSGINGTKQYTGNVAEKKWRSVTDNIKRAYGYDYDKADRLKQSTYIEYGSSSWNTNGGKFDEKDITYDANGNILTLKRYGNQGSTNFGLIDNLNYQYNGNFLGSVTDVSTTHGSMDFKDNGNTGNNEYTYDGNGNITANPNKNITNIVYNHLNLPTQITFTGTNNKIEYIYDAAGTRLRKKVTQNGAVSTRDYSGILEYNLANTPPLEFIHTSEGRCVPKNTSGTLQFRYEYQYTDNTGNVALAFSDIDGNGSITPSTEVIQQSSYYAFGMRMEGLGTSQILAENKYKFGGKEFNDDLGLNEYDFGARFYDPAIARWGCIDPMADATPNWTPFRYCFNNPITITDPTGMAEVGGGADDDDFVFGTKYTAGNRYIDINGQGEPTRKERDVRTNGYGDRFSFIDEVEVEKPKESNTRKYGGDGTGSFTDISMKVMDAVNDYNPFANIWDVIVYSYSGQDRLGNNMSLTEANLKAASVLPIGKIVKATSGVIVATTGKSGVKTFQVGTYKKLRTLSRGSGLDAHHVGQQAIMKKFIPGYNPANAPSILVPKLGHTLGTGVLSRSTIGIKSVRSGIARDVLELRRVYSVPNQQLIKLIEMNKQMYPKAFIKQ